MKVKLSRRAFLKSVTVMGSVAIYHFSTLSGAGPSRTAASQASKEEIMPHVSVKMYPGRSDKEKAALADAIVKDVMEIIGAGRSSISVAIEDIPPDEWRERVYDPEIRKKSDTLFIKPGYSM